MGKAKALHENSNFPTFLYCMPRNQEGPVQNPHTELPQDSAWDFRGAQVISDTLSAQFHVPDSLLIQLLGIPRKTDQTDIRPSVRSDVSNCFYQGVSNEWSPREQFQHAPNSEDQSRRDVQKRDVRVEHHMSCTNVHTHVANGQAHQNGRLVCGVLLVILEDLALALLFFPQNMEAACATEDHLLTGERDELWHGAPEFPRETSKSRRRMSRPQRT